MSPHFSSSTPEPGNRLRGTFVQPENKGRREGSGRILRSDLDPTDESVIYQWVCDFTPKSGRIQSEFEGIARL
jgi:hypothetical protein